MKYRILLFCGIAPLLLSTALSAIRGPAVYQVQDQDPPPPQLAVGELDAEVDFFRYLTAELGDPLSEASPADQNPPTVTNINSQFRELVTKSGNWTRLLSDIRSPEKLQRYCGAMLIQMKSQLSGLERTVTNWSSATDTELAQQMVRSRLAILIGIEQSSQQATQMITLWQTSQKLYKEGEQAAAIAATMDQAVNSFIEAREQIQQVRLEIFNQQDCVEQPADLTADALDNFIRQLTFMEDVTTLKANYTRTWPTSPRDMASAWSLLRNEFRRCREKYSETANGQAIPKIDFINPQEYEWLDKAHGRIEAKYQLAQIELPDDGEKLPIYCQQVKRHFQDLDDPNIKGAIRLDLRTWLLEEVTSAFYDRPLGFEKYRMMVDTAKKFNNSPGVVVVSENWTPLRGANQDKYYECSPLTPIKAAAVYRDGFAKVAMPTSTIYVFQRTWIRPNAEPDVLPPLTTHDLLSAAITNLMKRDARLHVEGTWIEFRAVLREELKNTQNYSDRGGQDFGALQSTTQLVEFVDSVIAAFKMKDIAELLTPPDSP